MFCEVDIWFVEEKLGDVNRRLGLYKQRDCVYKDRRMCSMERGKSEACGCDA